MQQLLIQLNYPPTSFMKSLCSPHWKYILKPSSMNVLTMHSRAT